MFLPFHLYLPINSSWYCREFNQNSQPVRNKKNRENTRQRRQSHAQDNIYVVRQFAYVHGVAGISLLSGRNTKCGYHIFSLRKNDNTKKKNPNNQITLSTSGGLSMSASAWAYRPKSPLHGLSLSKSPIKNHATLFGSG